MWLDEMVPSVVGRWTSLVLLTTLFSHAANLDDNQAR